MPRSGYKDKAAILCVAQKCGSVERDREKEISSHGTDGSAQARDCTTAKQRRDLKVLARLYANVS